MKTHNLFLSKLSLEQKTLRKRILEISHQGHFSHLGSCFSAIDAIDSVYSIKRKTDKFILSNGHAGVALYAVLEKYGYIPDPQIIKTFNIHPDRNPIYDIHVSTGSLGQGLPIALGMAIASPNENIYCMMSDGECTEGSVWEALRVAVQMKISNLQIVLIANGWGAYDAIDLVYLKKRLLAFGCVVTTVDGHNPKKMQRALQTKKNKKIHILFAKTSVEQLPFLSGQDAHYYIMTNSDYMTAVKKLK